MREKLRPDLETLNGFLISQQFVSTGMMPAMQVAHCLPLAAKKSELDLYDCHGLHFLQPTGFNDDHHQALFCCGKWNHRQTLARGKPVEFRLILLQVASDTERALCIAKLCRLGNRRVEVEVRMDYFSTDQKKHGHALPRDSRDAACQIPLAIGLLSWKRKIDYCIRRLVQSVVCLETKHATIVRQAATAKSSTLQSMWYFRPKLVGFSFRLSIPLSPGSLRVVD